MRWTVAALAVLTGACPGPSTGTKRVEPTLESDRALLTIPVVPQAEEALGRIEARAAGGSIEAAWARAHYLIDLFDDARFRRDDASLRMLASVIDPTSADPLGRGSEATDDALAFLLLQVDGVLAADRLHAGALAARTLLEFDAQPPTARNQLFQRMLELKSVARSTAGPMADNAVLRLAGFCRQALTDATAAAWAERMRTVAHCLYPLYDSDPAPYFDTDPARRPPPPDVGDLLGDLEQLLAPVVDRRRRLEFAASFVIEQLDEFAATGATELPVIPERGSLGLVAVDAAPFYDWTPVIAIGDGSTLAGVPELTQALIAEVTGDGRGIVALAAAADAPATAALPVAEAALAAGATRLELAVWTDQQLSVPAGDYWHGRLDGGAASRLGVIPLSLAVLGGMAAERATRPDLQQRWDPDLATLGVHLVVGPDRWVLTSPTGRVAEIAATGDDTPERELRDQLARLRRAFGSEDGLVIVPADGVSMGALTLAAAAAFRDDAGHPLFSRIALATTAPEPTGDALAKRIAARHRAVVTIDPEELASRAPIVRACYQDLLEKAPTLGATVTLEAASDNVVVKGTKVAKGVRACVVDGVGPMMRVRDIGAATVTLSPQ